MSEDSSSDDSVLEGWALAPFLEKVTGIAPNIIYIYNQQTQSNEYANRSLAESLGYTSKEIQEMGDAFFLNICHPDDLASIAPHFATLSQLGDGEVAQLEYRMRHKNGNWVWLLSYDTVFERNESGEVVRHLGIATDITRQKVAQEFAEAERRAADAANEELRSFAYSISHDMKAPSNTLRMLLNELKEGHGESFDTDAQELLALSLKTVGRMQILIADVLNYTQIVGQEIEFVDVDLNELFAEIFEDMLGNTIQKNAELTMDHLPIVKGSRTQLRILFQNLVDNALKYQSYGSRPVVSVSSTSQEQGESTYVHVKDNGIGIAPEYQYRVFEMFRRLHVNSEYPGTGLGLAICKRIALRHGGDVFVESAVDKGATFTVVFKH